MKVLVTGGAGYIGSVLVRKLLKDVYYVRVLDNLMFGGESLLGVYNEPNFHFIRGDIRDKKALAQALKDIDCVIHLAALVGHPLCQSQPEMTKQVNYEASRLLLKQAVRGKVKRFIFVSTCSNYGISDNAMLADEDSALKPLSIYAKAKVKAEGYMLSFPKKKGFSLCVLRLATVFGVSAHMRFDLLINELVRDALLKKKVAIQNPYAWRPFLHIRDAADSFARCLKADPKQISGEVFNVGCGNYQKKEIVELIKKHIPSVAIKILEDDKDGRDYKVSFEKIKKALGFKAKLTLGQGIIEIKETIEKGIVSSPFSLNYSNQRFLK